jgi:hypothetical protein
MDAMPNSHFLCPCCKLRLECPSEYAGLEVTCPACQAAFLAPSPSASSLSTAANTKGGQVKYWVVDARVLLLREPPSYVKTLMEVPKSWNLPPDGTLPEPAFEAVKKTIRTKFPQCPITPVKVRAADQQALKRASGPIDYGNESCKTWFIGKAAP